MIDNNDPKLYAVTRYAAGGPDWEVEEMLSVSSRYDDDELAEVMDSLEVDEFILYELVPRKIVIRRPSVVVEDIK